MPLLALHWKDLRFRSRKKIRGQERWEKLMKSDIMRDVLEQRYSKHMYLYTRVCVCVCVCRLLQKECLLFISMETAKSTTMLWATILSQKTLYFDIVTTISYTFSTAMNRNLHAVLVAIWNMVCPSHHCCQCWSATPTTSLCSHPLFGLHESSTNINQCLLVPFFCIEEFSDIPLLHLHFHVRCHFFQTAPLLSSVTWQK